MPKMSYRIGELKCAFWEWMPKQRILAIDFGENEKEREETIEAMWKRFVEILQRGEKKP